VEAVIDSQTSQSAFIVRFWADESAEATAWWGTDEQIGMQWQGAFHRLGELEHRMRLALVGQNWSVKGGCECDDCCVDGTDG
jgi:hypothetical protein